MAKTKKLPPEAGLALRSLEEDTDLQEGELTAEVERDGDARIVRVRDGEGKPRHVLGRFPASPEPSRLLPEWVPFLPNTSCTVLEIPGPTITYEVSIGDLEKMRKRSADLAERMQDLDIPRPLPSFKQPDGADDPVAFQEFAETMRAKLPPELVSEMKDLFLEGTADTGALDRAWELLRTWYVERGWQVEDREPTGPGALGMRSRTFSLGPARHFAGAMSMMGLQTIMVSVMDGAG